MSSAALAGIRVVELGQMVSAPYCAKLLADFGAEVVKVEPRGHGDRARHWGPFPGDVAHIEKSGLFHFLNTAKRGVALDVDTAADRERFLALVADADVLVENNSPAWMRAAGLDYDTLAALNPGLVMISITPFGQDGPYAEWNGYDLNAFHLSAAGHRYCGRRGEPPLEQGTFAADFYGATVAAAWGLAATVGRDTAGGGQHVDVSVSEAVAATFVGGQNIGGVAQDGRFDRRTGVGMGLNAPAAIMPCKDGYVWMIVLETGQWRGLREAMGDPEWAQLDMFDDMYVRGENKDLIYPLVESWTMQHTKTEIMERCQAAGCPITAVFTVAEAVEHPHLRERGYIVELDHSELGTFRDLGAPFHLPACPGGPAWAAPKLGEHDDLLGSPRVVDEGGRVPLRLSGRGSGRPDTATTPAPLDGIRVANFGWVWAGPMVGQTLAFLGAEVYKVESRARIDMARTIPPFAEGERDPNRCLSQHAGWAGNGSVTINLRSAEGIELARRFVAECDVVVENFGPGVMEKLGLGYGVLSADNPGLVMFSMPAAGLTGPLSGLRTYGLSLASLAGLDSITGYVGEGPLAMENAFSDPFNGIMGAYSIVVALRHRENTGAGQHVDYSQQEAVMQMAGPAVMDYVLNGRIAGPKGNRHPLAAAAPHGVFPCAGDDSWIAIACVTDDEWQALVSAMGDPPWAHAGDYATLESRVDNIEALHAHIGEWTAPFDHRRLTIDLQGAGVAATPVLSIGELLDDPQYRARNTYVTLEHPLGFESTIYGAYVKTSRSDARVSLGPVLGRDNDHVFRELLGISGTRYDELVADEVIY